jgi:uncharacterized protein with ATP-grasp and redox domains
MRTYPDCYPCLVRHSLDAIKRATNRVDQQKALINRILQVLSDEALDVTPVRLTAAIHRLIQVELGVEDTYRALREKCNMQTLNLLPGLYSLLDQAADRLAVAARIAIAGNIIDYGSTGESFNLEKSLTDCRTSALGIDDFECLRADLAAARRIVYVGDNAGEITFDRLFIEEIKKFSDPEIVFVVRGKPILNDATIEDARAVGLPDVVRVISSGGDGPGCELQLAPSEVIRHFETADLIIAKGQGNYEALSDEPYHIYFLLKVKCSVIATDIGACKGDSVVKLSRNGVDNCPN